MLETVGPPETFQESCTSADRGVVRFGADAQAHLPGPAGHSHRGRALRRFGMEREVCAAPSCSLRCQPSGARRYGARLLWRRTASVLKTREASKTFHEQRKESPHERNWTDSLRCTRVVARRFGTPASVFVGSASPGEGAAQVRERSLRSAQLFTCASLVVASDLKRHDRRAIATA